MFRIDALSRQPVYEQIIDQLERLVLAGVIKPGEQIPSVRSLSVQLSINPNTIQKAYAELDRRGILCSVPGRGCYISENARALLSIYFCGRRRKPARRIFSGGCRNGSARPVQDASGNASKARQK